MKSLVRMILILSMLPPLAIAVADAAISTEATAAPIARTSYIVVFDASVADPARAAAQIGKQHGFAPTFIYRHALKGYAATIPPAALAGITADPRVEAVSEDGQVVATDTCPLNTTSGFPTQCIPPGVDRVEADLSSTAAGDGSGSVDINVAVLDGGIDVDHPDLNVVGGKDCSGGKGVDAAPGDSHGTLVAGVIGAKDNGFGVTGVAPGAKIWAVRVLNKHGFGSWSQVICGIDFVTGTRTDSDPTNDIAVANMSLGGPVSEKQSDDGNCGLTKPDATHRAVCASVAAGVFYAAAAGNTQTDIRRVSPAAYDEVLTVTAMADFDGKPGGLFPRGACGDFDDSLADFTSFATLPADQAHTIAAPGVCVVGTFPVGSFLPDFDTNYGISSGTSFSSPHAAGAASLCIASGACTGLTSTQIIQKLRGDAEAYALAHPAEGFYGDPTDPEAGKYLGYLLRAEGY